MQPVIRSVSRHAVHATAPGQTGSRSGPDAGASAGADPGTEPEDGPPPQQQRAGWRWAKRVATLGFFALVAWLLLGQARQIDWASVWTSVQQRSTVTLGLAAALAACSHVLYSSFDLFGRRLSGHRLPASRVMAITFVSYVYNLNLGTLIGGMAFRYRLYWRQGLRTSSVTTVLVTSMITNWSGYLALAGVLLLWQPPDLPAGWGMPASALPLLGAGMLLLAGSFMLACAVSRRRSITVRGKRIDLPGGWMALQQVGVSALNWALMSGVMYALLDGAVAWSLVLGALLVAAVAGVATHIPGGLGVIEAVFLGLLSPAVPADQVLAAVLLYRAMYYLAPLLAAVLVQLALERSAPKARDAA
jgi:glycosyltransferase 2 family protein